MEYSEVHCEGNVWSTVRSILRAMFGVQLKNGKAGDLMLILGFIEVIKQLAMATSVCWYGHVLTREDGHVLRSE